MNDINNTNPLITGIRLPGDTVRIPSRGAFYSNGELASHIKNGEVHVYPMRAIDEITMRSPDKLLNGDAVVEVFAHCIPDVLNAKQMFAKDIDYLMIALRRITYGFEYEFSNLHTCENAERHNYIVDINQFIKTEGELDPVQYETKHKYIVPRTGQTVMFQPMRYADVIEVMNATVEEETATNPSADKKRSLSLMPDKPIIEQSPTYTRERKLFQSLLTTINNVNGITDKDMIVEWLATLTAPEIRAMLDQLDTIGDWGPTYNTAIKCKDCGEMIELLVPVNPINFFI